MYREGSVINLKKGGRAKKHRNKVQYAGQWYAQYMHNYFNTDVLLLLYVISAHCCIYQHLIFHCFLLVICVLGFTSANAQAL